MFRVRNSSYCRRESNLPKLKLNVSAPIVLTTRPRACEWRWLQFGITGTGPSSPHPGVDTGAYATPLVACTGRGARHTDGRDRGGYM
eukprot:scaffold4875_cov67-Phaeocystis_antarctica.AAC.2